MYGQIIPLEAKVYITNSITPKTLGSIIGTVITICIKNILSNFFESSSSVLIAVVQINKHSKRYKNDHHNITKRSISIINALHP